MSDSEIENLKSKKLKEIALENVDFIMNRIVSGETVSFINAYEDLQGRTNEFNAHLMENYGVSKIPKLFDYHLINEFNELEYNKIDSDWYTPVETNELKLLDIRLVSGKALNLYCFEYLDLVHADKKKHITMLNNVFEVIKGFSKKEVIVFSGEIWTEHIFTLLAHYIHNIDENSPIPHKTIVSRCQNLFNTLTGITTNDGNFVKFLTIDVTRALWIEVDNFRFHNDSSTDEKKLERVFKLIKVGALSFVSRDSLKFKTKSKTQFEAKLKQNAYNKLSFIIPIYIYECFYDKNKRISTMFENVILRMFKNYDSKDRTNNNQKFMEGFSKNLQTSSSVGLITNERGQFDALNLLIKHEFNNVQSSFGYGYGYTDRLSYADEYDYDSEFGSSGGGSFDDNYGFGASGAEYDDYDDY